MPKVIAILASDIHLSHKPPIARSAEKDWYLAMQRSLDQLAEIQSKFPKAVMIYAGDIFDRANSPPELINFALRCLPNGYSVAGQHDLINHNIQDIEKSAYWTLVRAGKLKHLCNGYPICISKLNLAIHGTSWEERVVPISECEIDFPKKSTTINLAVIHKYIWKKGCSFPGAPKEAQILKISNELNNAGYTAAVFGDNHLGFLTYDNKNKLNILNCGSFICRNSDQKDYKPMVGLLWDDGTISCDLLNTSKDKWSEENSTRKSKEVDLSNLLKDFKEAVSKPINFIDELENAFRSDKFSEPTKRVLKEILESVKC